jgi:hypothetical protein
MWPCDRSIYALHHVSDSRRQSAGQTADRARMPVELSGPHHSRTGIPLLSAKGQRCGVCVGLIPGNGA